MNDEAKRQGYFLVYTVESEEGDGCCLKRADAGWQARQD